MVCTILCWLSVSGFRDIFSLTVFVMGTIREVLIHSKSFYLLTYDDDQMMTTSRCLLIASSCMSIIGLGVEVLRFRVCLNPEEPTLFGVPYYDSGFRV